MTVQSNATSYEANLKALNPQDRAAVDQGFTYRLEHPGGRVEYARSLQAAIDARHRKLGETQAKITALPWMRTPQVEQT